MNGVKFMNDVHFMNDVQFMPSVNIMKDVQLMPDVTGLQNVTPYSGYKPRRLYSVNDSYEKANSLLDVLLGDTQNRVLLEEKGLGWAADIPILDKLTGVSVLINNKYLEPIENLLHGNTTLEQTGKELFFNTLIEISEDLDIFSNIIKSQITEAGGEPGLENLKSSLGYGGVRKVYNFNTGNFLLDLTGEILSDPLTVLELGSSALIKESEKATKETIESAIKQTNKQLSKKATRNLTDAVYETLVKKGSTSYDDVIKYITNEDTLKALYKTNFKDIYPEVTKTITNAKGYKIYNKMSTFYKGVDSLDKTLTKATWAMTPVPAFKYAVKPIVEKTSKHIYNYVIRKLNNYPILRDFVGKQAIYKELKREAWYINEAMYETTFKNVGTILNKLNLSIPEFEEYVYAFIKEHNGVIDLTIKANRDKFLDFLKEHSSFIRENVGVGKRISNDWYRSLAVDPRPLARNPFLDAIFASAAGGFQFYKVENEVVSNYNKARISSLKRYMNKYADNLEKMYDYVDKHVLTYNNLYYGFDNINEFLARIITDKKVTKSMKKELATLLDTLNINQTTAPRISKILKSNNKNKSEALKKLIAKYSGADPLFESKYYKNTMNKIETKIKNNTNTIINRAWEGKIATYNTEGYRIVMQQTHNNIKDAVDSLKTLDNPHAIEYVQNAIRLQDLPRSEDFLEHMKTYYNYVDYMMEMDSERALASKNPSGIISHSYYMPDYNKMKAFEKFLKQTENILDNISTKPTMAYEIIDWYQELLPNYKFLKEVDIGLASMGNAYAVKAHDDIRKMLNIYNTLLNDDIKDNLVNFVTNIEGLVQPQASHLGMFNVLTQHTHLSLDKDTKFLLDQLSDTNSIYRTELIPAIIDLFERAKRPGDVNNIKKLLAQIDTVRNLNVMLSSDINVSFELSTKLDNSIKNIVFDAIDNHKDYLITDILASDEGLEIITSKDGTQHIINRLGKEVKDTRTYTEFLNNEIPRRHRVILISDIINRIKNTDTITSELLTAANKANIPYEDALEQLQEEASRLLIDYVDAQEQLLKYIDNVSLATLYSSETINTIQGLNNITFKQLLRYTDYTTTSVQDLNLFKTFQTDLYKFAEAINLGIHEIENIDKGVRYPLSAMEARRIFKNISNRYNLYSASIESNMYTAKYLLRETYKTKTGEIIEGFEDVFKLSPKNFTGSNEEFIMLHDKLWAYRDVLHEQYKYKPEYFDKLRQALIETYDRPHTLFAPMNPSEYFNKLDAEQLLAWEVVTDSNMSLNNKHAFDEAIRKLGRKEAVERYTTSKMLSDLDAVLRNMGSTDDEMIGHFADVSRRTGAARHMYEMIDANFAATLHELDDLNINTNKINKFIKQDIAVHKDITDRIIKLEEYPEIHTTFNYNEIANPDDMYRLFGVTYGYEDTLDIAQHYLYLERSNNLARNIAAFNAEELATYIYKYTDGALVFRNEDIIKILYPDGSTAWSGIPNIFNFKKEELEAAGLKIMKDVDDNGTWYHIRLTDNRVHNTELRWLNFESAFGMESHGLSGNIQDAYSDIINRHKLYLNLNYDDDIPTNLLKIETLNENTWNTYLDNYSKFYGNPKERKLYQKLTPHGNSSFFNKSFERLNLSVVGGGNTYNIWNQKYSLDFIPRSTQLSKNTLSGMVALINRSNKINKYLTLFFNNDWSLQKSPLLQALFSESTDQEIREFFAQGKYRVAILKQDKQSLPKVYEYFVTNRKSLDVAREAGGILVPTSTFNAMRSVVNNRKMTNGLLDIYRRVVPTTYKTFYLYTAGFPFRNAIDTLIYKNANELGGITELADTFKYEHAASKALEFHNEVQQKVLDLTGGETFNKQTLLEVLANNYTKEEAELYFLTDLFIESEASGGLSDALSEYLEVFNKKGVDDIRSKWERYWEEKILFGKQPLNPLRFTRDLNSHIEQSGRFGLFLALVDKGLPIDESIERVIKTHFNYKSTSDIMDICERIFWFSTFPINNINYYVNGGLTKSPTMLKLLMDAQTASWNNGEYTYEELKKTNFLAYHAMSGNIRIGNKIIKISPSLFDFIGLVTNLPQNAMDRLNPILSIPANLDNLEEELNPLQTQFRLFPKQLRGENILPSIISDINKYDWDRTLLKWRSNYNKKQSHWNKYPKIRKSPAYRSYVRKYYSRRYYTNVRKLSRTSLYHDAINYYRLGGRRGITYRDL